MADTAAQKKEFLDQLKTTMTSIGILVDRANTMAALFVDREYDAAAADPITAGAEHRLDEPSALRWSPDGRWLTLIDASGGLAVWELMRDE